MAIELEPFPNVSTKDGFDRPEVQQWFHRLFERVGNTLGILFTDLDFTGSNLTQLATRLFTDLQFTGSNLTSLVTRLFTDLQFAGSNITSIVTRDHNDLTTIENLGTTVTGTHLHHNTQSFQDEQIRHWLYD